MGLSLGFVVDAAMEAFDASRSTNVDGQQPLRKQLIDLQSRETGVSNLKVLDHWKDVAEKDRRLGKLTESVLALPVTQISSDKLLGALSVVPSGSWINVGDSDWNKRLTIKLNLNKN